jgi:GNAT superfamily N-acetyltransferase
MQNNWSEDLCSQFKNYQEYSEKGLGVVALHNGDLVSGASSYTVYRDGIEIEIDTRVDYRRKGLAFACGAKLILECINRNLYPSWDAQNKWSVALAEKLGYHFDKEYEVYEVTGYGTK